MLPTSLLADPAISVAGSRAPSVPRVAKAKAKSTKSSEPIRARWLVLAAAFVLVAATFGYLRTWPPLATVMSGSMAPTINTGDIVVLKRLDGPARVGQIVMVHVPDEARTRYGYPPVVIHRIKSIDADGLVTTQGDARKDTDPFQVPRATLTERVVTHLPAAGQFLGFFTSTLGLLWLASGAVIFLGAPLLERSKRSANERDRVLEEALKAAADSQARLAAHLAELPAQLERAVAAAVPAPVEPEPLTFSVIAPPVCPPAPPVPAPPAPVAFTLDLAPAGRWDAAPRLVAAGAPQGHGLLCAVGGPSRLIAATAR